MKIKRLPETLRTIQEESTLLLGNTLNLTLRIGPTTHRHLSAACHEYNTVTITITLSRRLTMEQFVIV